MATTTPRHLHRIAKLMRDPRYWNKKDPEHPKVFADAQNAFESAYPEPAPETDTTDGNVHVRAYTRIVDGEEVQVSAYDRAQKIVFHPPALPKQGLPDYLQEIAEGRLHKQTKADLVAFLRSHGDTVETEITLVGLNGTIARVDILGKSPNGFMYAIEVKTTAYDFFSKGQAFIYPLLELGDHVVSTSPRIRQFGIAPLQPLPPICVYGKLVGPGKLRRPMVPLSVDPICIPPSWRSR